MFWQKLWDYLKSLWHSFNNRKTSEKCNTTLDTVSLKVFGLEIKVTREVPAGVPYELTVVVPRAEIRGAQNNREIILSSITIAHSPRFEGRPASKPAAIPAVKPVGTTAPEKPPAPLETSESKAA